ncbi:hypothetical protein HBI32_190120 [Parastagonospora nodorum]|nr:hypothetical protein HBI32_190120 [Parastagonospora nodorum]
MPSACGTFGLGVFMVQPPPPSSTMDTPRTCHLHLHPHSSIRSPIHPSDRGERHCWRMDSFMALLTSPTPSGIATTTFRISESHSWCWRTERLCTWPTMFVCFHLPTSILWRLRLRSNLIDW